MSFHQIDEGDDGTEWINGQQIVDYDEDGDPVTEDGSTYSYAGDINVEDDDDEREPGGYWSDDYQPPTTPEEDEADYAARLAGQVNDIQHLQRDAGRSFTHRELRALDAEMRRQHEAGEALDAHAAFAEASYYEGGVTEVDMDNGDSRRAYLEERARDLNAPSRALSADEVASAERFLAHDGSASMDDREAYFAARLADRIRPSASDDGEYEYTAEAEEA